MLVTLNYAPGETVYGEKKVVIENDGNKKEYRQVRFVLSCVYPLLLRCVAFHCFTSISPVEHFTQAHAYWSNKKMILVVVVEPLPIQIGRRYPWWSQEHLHEAWKQGSLFGCRLRNVRLPRLRPCRPGSFSFVFILPLQHQCLLVCIIVP
jgi:hypothetical protein